MKRRVEVLFLLAVLIVVAAGCGSSTSVIPHYPDRAAFSGYVYVIDSSSGRIANAAPSGFVAVADATVELISQSSSESRTAGRTAYASFSTTTDSEGYYIFNDVDLGEYTLRITSTQLSSPAEKTVTVSGNQQQQAEQSTLYLQADGQSAEPSATITLPVDGTSVIEDTAVNFIGAGLDYQNQVLTGDALVWTSSIDGQFGTGTNFSTSTLSIGVHTISLVVTDSMSLVATDTITFTVTSDAANTAPTVVTISPSTNDSFDLGEPITFACTAYDEEDGVLAGDNIVWSSNLDGQIGTGTTFRLSTLQSGAHQITITATDKASTPLSTSVRVNITVTTTPAENSAPQVVITQPLGDYNFEVGESISFAAIAVDNEDGQLTGNNLHWTSVPAGVDAYGESVSTSSLAAGSYVVTVTATDNGTPALTGSAAVTINVQEAGSTNQAPEVTITSPSPTAYNSFELGTSVSFAGTAVDAEDGTLSGGSMVWTSSIDGEIGTGTSFSVSNLTTGAHIITLTATDNGDPAMTGAAFVNVVIFDENTAPQVVITSPRLTTTFAEGVSITFTGVAVDTEDGQLEGSNLVWTSDPEAINQTGTTFNDSSLTAGTYVVTLTATDNGTPALSGSSSVTITITE